MTTARFAASRNRVLWVFLLLMIASLSVWLSFREPAFQGTPASFWLDHMDSEADRAAAVSAFQSLGKPGVLFLARIIKDGPEKREASLFQRLADSRLPMPDSFREALASRPSPIDRRRNALFVVGKLGPIAEFALPELMRQFNAAASSERIDDDDSVFNALEAMGDMKADYTQDFIRAFQECRLEPNVSLAARLLASIGPKAKGAIPALLNKLPNGSDDLSNSIADALWKIDRQTNAVLNILANNLRNLTTEYQMTTLGELRGMGLAGKPAAALVLHSVLTSTEPARTEAAETLREIDPDLYRSSIDEANQHPGPNIERLIEIIGKSGQQRIPALQTICLYGPAAKPAVPTLIQVLQECIPQTAHATNLVPYAEIVVWNAADALAEIGPEAVAAVYALVSSLPTHVLNATALARSRPEITAPCRALGIIGSGAAAATPALQSLLQNQNPVIQTAAASALARIEPHSYGLVNILRSLAANSNTRYAAQISLPAKVALWRLGMEKGPPVQGLMEALSDPWSYDAIQLLGDIGPPACAALPQLKRLLGSDKDILIRRLAAIAIRKIDPKEADNLNLPGIMALP